MKRHVDLRRGTLSNVWTVSWPVMASLLLYVAQINVDMVWVGRLGADEVAAVAISGAVWFVVMALIQAVGGGAAPLVGRHTGAGQEAARRAVVRGALGLTLAGSLVVAAAGALLTDSVLSQFSLEPAVRDHGVAYLRVLFYGVPLIYGGRVAFDIINATGDTRTPLKITALATALNLALDPLLIFGWGPVPALGVTGAAVATVAAHGICCVLGLRAVQRQIGLGRRGAGAAEARSILAIGLPACLQALSRPVTGMLLFGIAAHLGTAVLAGFGIGLRCLSLMFVYLESLGVATRTLVAQHLGAGDPRRAREVVRRVLLLGLVLQAGVTLIYQLAAPAMVALFNARPGVVAAGTGYLRVVAAAMPLLVPITACGGAQSGAGHTRPPMAASLLGNWVVKLPLAYLAVHHLPAEALSSLGGAAAGLWLAVAASIVAEAVVVVLTYLGGAWARPGCKPQAAPADPAATD